MIYLQLFLSFLQIGAFSFGGGYAAMPLIREQVITQHGWLTESAFTDLIAVAEMTPGPIAVNAATFVGSQVAGIPGSLAATVGVILPSCVVVTILAYLYTKYRSMRVMQGALACLRPAVVAMICAAGLAILLPVLFQSGAVSFAAGNFKVRGFILFAAALLLLRVRKTNPILVMTGCGAAELICRLLTRSPA